LGIPILQQTSGVIIAIEIDFSANKEPMRVLFVCSRNRMRSPTAEAVFAAHEGLETLSAGTEPDAPTPVDADLIEWADIIFAMENRHRDKLRQRFGKQLEQKRLIVLGIRDDYDYMQPELVEILKRKVPQHLPGLLN
jgi:predicted protein tyrosine phosphatase